MNKTRWLSLLLALALAVCLWGVMPVGKTQAAVLTYYSQGSSAPDQLASWNNARDGSGTPPANFTDGSTFVIQNSHNMTTGAAWTVSGTGATIEIENGGTLTANHKVTVATFQVDNGGTYIHNWDNATGNGSANDFPGTTRVLGASSNVILNNWASDTGTAPAALPSVAFGNLTINVATFGGSWNMNLAASGTLTVNGNLIIQATGGGTRELRISNNNNTTLQIGGNFEISGGRFDFTNSNTTTNAYTLNVGGNLNFSGGTWEQNNGTLTVNFTGGSSSVTFTQLGSFSGATLERINWTIATGKTVQAGSNLQIGTGRTLTINGVLEMDTYTLTVNGSLVNNGQLEQTQTVSGNTDVTFLGTSGSTGLVLNANNVDLGATEVTIQGGQNCDTNNTSVRRCFEITPTNNGGRNATATFYYDSTELGGQSCENMKAYRWNGTAWELAGTTVATQCTTNPYSLQVTGIEHFSHFALSSHSEPGSEGPTSLTLRNLTAQSSTRNAVGLLALALGLMVLSGGLLTWKRKQA